MIDHDDARGSARDAGDAGDTRHGREGRDAQDDTGAHDILAAEEFGMGTADPALHHESPHDILAAEEFEVPAGDPALHHGPLTVPVEPGAGPRAHDVLAADEFAVPAGPARAEESDRSVVVGLGPRGLLAVAALAALILWRRRR